MTANIDNAKPRVDAESAKYMIEVALRDARNSGVIARRKAQTTIRDARGYRRAVAIGVLCFATVCAFLVGFEIVLVIAANFAR